MIRFSLLGLLTFAFLFTAAAAQDNWPRFRGPNADGVAPDNVALPTTWSNTDNVAWAADVPGWGWSCPIVWGDRVFVTSVVSEEENLTPSKGLYLGQGVREPANGIHHWMVHCFDLNTGKEIWKHEAHSGQPQMPHHPKSTYTLFDRGFLTCHDATTGEEVFDPKDNSWRRLADLPSAVTHINLHSRCSLREHNVRFAERTTTITVLDRAV